MFENQPVNKVFWIHRDRLTPNGYNPNVQHESAFELLIMSILEDGWTQPIVVTPIAATYSDFEALIADISICFEIIDGYHRYLSSGKKEVYCLTNGYVPIVISIPRDRNSQKMSTIRHNRAKGTHTVLSMSEIVAALVADNVSMQEICSRLGMEREEVRRLTQRAGVPADSIFENTNWSKEWIS